jgi:hypothetical protein
MCKEHKHGRLFLYYDDNYKFEYPSGYISNGSTNGTLHYDDIPTPNKFSDDFLERYGGDTDIKEILNVIKNGKDQTDNKK